MAMNMDAILRIKADTAGAVKVNAALEGMRRLTQQLADTQAKGAAANNQAMQQTIQLNQRLAQATTAAGISINNAEKQILSSKLQHVKTDKERQAIQDQLANLEIKNARMRRQSAENELSTEVKLAEKKREATQIELRRAQAAVATAGKYGQITPEIMRQAEAARKNAQLADQELTVTRQIASEKRKVADAQLKATEHQAEMSRAVDTTKSKMSQLGQVIAGIGLADLARRMGEFSRSSLQSGEQAGMVGRRIQNLAGQFGEAEKVTRLAADSAKRYGLGQLEAAEGVSNLYARLRPMGISLQEIRATFFGVNNAAKVAGLSVYDANEAFRQLGQAMGSGRLQGDELRSLMERMPAIGRAIVDVFNDIARSKGLEQISKEKADVLIKQTKEGEKRQTEILKEQAALRIQALRNETDKHLDEIDKRYRRQQQLMEDRFEDQDDAVRRSNDRQLDATIDGISERADFERKAIERRFEDRRKIVEDDKTINDALKTQLLRNLEDEQSAVLKAIQDREEAATTQVRDAADARNKEISRANRDARQVQLEQLQAAQQREEDAINASMERQKASLEAKLKSDIEANKRATASTLANLVASTKITVGDLKQMGADGLITTDILVMAMKKLEQITPPPPTAMQQFTAAMADLRMELGQNLLPILTPGVQLLTGLLRAFNALPGPIKAVVGGVMLLAGAVAAITLPLAGLAGALSLLAGTGLKTAILAAFGGVLSWMGTVFVPTMVAFFSGPAGWITLAVIAVGAMVIAFREPIGKFLAWVGEGIAKVAKTIGDGITGAIGSAWQWLTKAVGNVAQALAKPFEVAVGGIKSAVRGVLQYVATSVNIVAELVNNLIRGFNRLPGPDLPQIPFVTVPSFAGGGYTGSGPRAGGIDGRGGFMAMLHPQETVIDHTRGAAAALGGAATAAASAPSITIQTGPIYRLPDGTDTVSVGDLQAAMQATAAAVMGQLRRPGAQLALGIR